MPKITKFGWVELWSLKALLISTLFAGCTNPHKGTKRTFDFGENENSTKWSLADGTLSEALAAERARRIFKIHYQLKIQVDGQTKTFSGDQNITFHLDHPPVDLPLEFQDGEVKELIINAHRVNVERGPLFVRLPSEFLQRGSNSVHIVYEGLYSRSGAGLHRFEDPVDNNIYLYTDFEPHDANRWAPVFDQPDLKAQLNLEVMAPKKWNVIANSPVAKKTAMDSINQWTFQPTPPLSTYLFAMMAGPYHEWKGHYKKVPLGLYARESLASHVSAKEWFEMTRQGLKYFEKFFGGAYPFSKYDQIIVPEFNAGAMENVGAVTFSERFVHRGGYTELELARINGTIFHEMAHMWFGNLVTMKWWNDLWLNESFATFMAAKALDEATAFKYSWLHFRDKKNEAYDQDDLVATHPIAGEVKTSAEAFTNFDNITYEKGASVIKALHHYVGGDGFQKAMKHYFDKHAFGNTTLEEFMAAFESTLNRPLRPWFSAWLKSTGTDVITWKLNCENSVFKSNELTLRGGAPRPHSIEVGHFSVKDGGLKQTETFHVAEIIGKQNVEYGSPRKSECPRFAYPNLGDHAYVKVRFSPEDLTLIKSHILKSEDPLLRMSVFSDLWQMVRDGELDPNWYADLALRALDVEPNLTILTSLTDHVAGGDDSLYHFWPRTNADEEKKFVSWAEQFENVVWKRHLRAKDIEERKVILDQYIRVVATPRGIEALAQLLSKIQDIDREWKILLVLCEENHPDWRRLLADELKKDPTESGKKQALACEARNPDPKLKSKFLAQLTAKSSPYTASETDRITKSLFLGRQKPLLSEYEKEIYQSLSGVWLNRDRASQKDLARGLAPVYCQTQANQRLNDFMEAHRDLPVALRKPLLEKWDLDRRCLKIRKKFLTR